MNKTFSHFYVFIKEKRVPEPEVFPIKFFSVMFFEGLFSKITCFAVFNVFGYRKRVQAQRATLRVLDLLKSMTTTCDSHPRHLNETL